MLLFPGLTPWEAAKTNIDNESKVSSDVFLEWLKQNMIIEKEKNKVIQPNYNTEPDSIYQEEKNVLFLWKGYRVIEFNTETKKSKVKRLDN